MKKMARMKHVALFPSTYHEIHDTVLTWDAPRVNGWQIVIYKNETEGNEA